MYMLCIKSMNINLYLHIYIYISMCVGVRNDICKHTVISVYSRTYTNIEHRHVLDRAVYMQ
jgi:hypothetical protein